MDSVYDDLSLDDGAHLYESLFAANGLAEPVADAFWDPIYEAPLGLQTKDFNSKSPAPMVGVSMPVPTPTTTKSTTTSRTPGTHRAIDLLETWLKVYKMTSCEQSRTLYVQALFKDLNASHVFRTARNGGLVSFNLSEAASFAQIGQDKLISMDQTQGFIFDLQCNVLSRYVDSDPASTNVSSSVSLCRSSTWDFNTWEADPGLCTTASESTFRNEDGSDMKSINTSWTSSCALNRPLTRLRCERIATSNMQRALSAKHRALLQAPRLACSDEGEPTLQERRLEELCYEVFWEVLLNNERRTLMSFMTNERNNFHRQLDRYILGSSTKRGGSKSRSSQDGPFWSILRNALGYNEGDKLPTMRELLAILPTDPAPWKRAHQTMPLDEKHIPNNFAATNCLFNFGCDFSWKKTFYPPTPVGVHERKCKIAVLLLSLCRLLFPADHDHGKGTQASDAVLTSCLEQLSLSELGNPRIQQQLEILWMTMLHRYCGWIDRGDPRDEDARDDESEYSFDTQSPPSVSNEPSRVVKNSHQRTGKNHRRLTLHKVLHWFNLFRNSDSAQAFFSSVINVTLPLHTSILQGANVQSKVGAVTPARRTSSASKRKRVSATYAGMSPAKKPAKVIEPYSSWKSSGF